MAFSLLVHTLFAHWPCPHAPAQSGRPGAAHRHVAEHRQAHGGWLSRHRLATFLRALQVLGRLDAVLKVMAMENDVLGMELVREQLPQSVRTSSGKKRQARQSAAASERSANAGTDELEGF